MLEVITKDLVFTDTRQKQLTTVCRVFIYPWIDLSSVLTPASMSTKLCPQVPPPKERPGTHCLHMRKIFCYIFRKKLRALPSPYAEDYTNQEYRACFDIDSSDDLTDRTLLGYYFSDVTVSFFQMYSPTEGNKSVYQSGPFRAATEIVISLCTRFVAALPWTWSALNMIGLCNSFTKQQISSHSLSFICVKWICTIRIRNVW